jgi:hypothetical protein
LTLTAVDGHGLLIDVDCRGWPWIAADDGHRWRLPAARALTGITFPHRIADLPTVSILELQSLLFSALCGCLLLVLRIIQVRDEL